MVLRLRNVCVERLSEPLMTIYVSLQNYKRWWNTVRDAINTIQVAGERLKTSCDRLLALLADLHGYAHM
jgi:hypothetical protein